MVRRHIDWQAAHEALDHLLDVYQGRAQGFLYTDRIKPASSASRDAVLHNAEDELLKLLLPALPSLRKSTEGFRTRKGQQVAKVLRGLVVLWWAHVLGMGTEKAIIHARTFTGVDRSTVYRWLKAVPPKQKQTIELLADKLWKRGASQETAKLYAEFFTVDFLCIVHALATPGGSRTIKVVPRH